MQETIQGTVDLIETAVQSKNATQVVIETEILRRYGSLSGLTNVDLWILSWHPHAWLILHNWTWEDADVDALAKQMHSSYQDIDKSKIADALHVLKPHLVEVDLERINLYLGLRLAALGEEASSELSGRDDFSCPTANAAMRDIGQYLHRSGGEDRMRAVCDLVSVLRGNARLVEQFWNGIGKWRG